MRTLLILLSGGISTLAFSEITVKVTSHTNTKNNVAMEVCGSATSQSGQNVIVTVVHDESSYSTLTDAKGNWCTLIKRWSFNGKVDVTARTLSGNERSNVIQNSDLRN